MSQEDNTITLQKAQEWTTEWRSVESDYNKHNQCNGFLIPADDLQNVLDEMKNQSRAEKKVRAYLGVDPTTNKEKLIIVATEPVTQRDGTIIYRDKINGYRGLQSGGNLYDFTLPIPPASDPSSPLN